MYLDGSSPTTYGKLMVVGTVQDEPWLSDRSFVLCRRVPQINPSVIYLKISHYRKWFRSETGRVEN